MRANPIAICTFLVSSFDTKAAPTHAPTAAATSMEISVIGSTLTALIKRTASATTGHVQDTFKVPGITRSLICLKPRKRAVAGAKLPIPNVSKKLMPNPIAPEIKIFVSFSNSFL